MDKSWPFEYHTNVIFSSPLYCYLCIPYQNKCKQGSSDLTKSLEIYLIKWHKWVINLVDFQLQYKVLIVFYNFNRNWNIQDSVLWTFTPLTLYNRHLKYSTVFNDICLPQSNLALLSNECQNLLKSVFPSNNVPEETIFFDIKCPYCNPQYLGLLCRPLISRQEQ